MGKDNSHTKRKLSIMQRALLNALARTTRTKPKSSDDLAMELYQPHNEPNDVRSSINRLVLKTRKKLLGTAVRISSGRNGYWLSGPAIDEVETKFSRNHHGTHASQQQLVDSSKR